MKRAALLGMVLALGATAGPMQGQGPDALASRQGEIVRLAELYSIDLKHGDWAEEPLAVCPAFTQHGFALYHRSPMPGVRTAFVAVYPKGSGSVRLIPLQAGKQQDLRPAAERSETIAVFNGVWIDELRAAGNPDVFPGMSWIDLGMCFAGMMGEHPLSDKEEPNRRPLPALDRRQNAVGTMLIPLASAPSDPPGSSRVLGLKLNARGLVESAEITEQSDLTTPPKKL